jgi:restriction system protein
MGMAKYKVEVEHPELRRYRLISGEDDYFVRKKAQALKALWDGQWAKRVEREKKLSEKKSNGEIAAERTAQAVAAIDDIFSILEKALGRNPFDWESLREDQPFDKPFPEAPVLRELPPEPDIMDPQFKPAVGLMDKLLPGQKEKLQNKADMSFDQARQQWLSVKRGNEVLEEDYYNAGVQWEADKKVYLKSQADNNSAREQGLKDFLSRKDQTIVDYFEMVLYSGRNADYFPHQFKTEYNSSPKLLIVAYDLPEFKSLPILKEVRVNPYTGQFEEIFFNEEMQTQHYSFMAYQTALKTIHELFQSDLTNLLDTVVFNGMVEKAGDAAEEGSVCILSLQVSRSEFLTLNFNQDAKTCFRQLKGVISPGLSLATPVTPLKAMGRALTKWGGMEDMLLTDLRGAIGLELMFTDKESDERNL